MYTHLLRFLKMKRIQIHIKDEQDDILESVSNLTGLSRAEIIRFAIDSYVTNRGDIDTDSQDVPIKHMKSFKNETEFIENVIGRELYNFKKELIQEMYKGKGLGNYIIHNSRQIGITTLFNDLSIAKSIMNRNYKSLLICNKSTSAKMRKDDVLQSIDLLDIDIEYSVKNNVIYFSNGSEIHIIPSSLINNAIGNTFSLIHIDDAAFTIDLKRLVKVCETILHWGNIVITSVDSPKKSEFLEICIDSLNGRNNYKYLEYDYKCIKGRDTSWAIKHIEVVGINWFIREYACRGGFLND
jgi:hypothetical protein